MHVQSRVKIDTVTKHRVFWEYITGTRLTCKPVVSLKTEMVSNKWWTKYFLFYILRIFWLPITQRLELEWVTIPSPPGDLPDPGIKLGSLKHCRKILYQVSYQGCPRAWKVRVNKSCAKAMHIFYLNNWVLFFLQLISHTKVFLLGGKRTNPILGERALNWLLNLMKSSRAFTSI